MKVALRIYILTFSLLQLRFTLTLHHLDRFIDPSKPRQVITPNTSYSKVNIPGGLRNVEIALDGYLLGCNTGDAIYLTYSALSNGAWT